MTTLKEIEDQLSAAPPKIRKPIQKALALQFSSCFSEFCRNNSFVDEWITYYKAVYCYVDSEEQTNSRISEIDNIFETRNNELQEAEIPAFNALALAGYLQENDDRVYKESVSSFCHLVGALNIEHLNIDIDWVDPSIEIDRSFEIYLKHYLDFVSGDIDETKFLALSQLLQVRELMDFVSLSE